MYTVQSSCELCVKMYSCVTGLAKVVGQPPDVWLRAGFTMASQIAGLLNSGYFWLSVKSESSFTNWSIAFAHLQLTDWAVNLLLEAAIGGDVLRCYWRPCGSCVFLTDYKVSFEIFWCLFVYLVNSSIWFLMVDLPHFYPRDAMRGY